MFIFKFKLSLENDAIFFNCFFFFFFVKFGYFRSRVLFLLLTEIENEILNGKIKKEKKTLILLLISNKKERRRIN